MGSVADYQKCVRNLVAARQRMRDIVRTLNTVTAQLKDWERSDPRDINGALDRALEGWPSQVVIVSAIEQWKLADRAVATAWESIPHDERLRLVPPEQLKFPE